MISCFVIVVLISGQLSAQDTDTESSESLTTTTSAAATTESVKDVEAKRAKAFYGKLNETLSNQHSLYLKRVDCIIQNLENEKVFDKVNASNYEISDNYDVTFTNKEAIFNELEASIDSAAFSCTIVGYCAIILIVTVMLIVVSCVSCLSRKK